MLNKSVRVSMSSGVMCIAFSFVYEVISSSLYDVNDVLYIGRFGFGRYNTFSYLNFFYINCKT